MSNVILCNLSDAQEVIEEARDEWIVSVLLALDVPEEFVEMGFSGLDDYDDFQLAMSEMGIEIELLSNGEVNVYKQVWLDGPESGWLPSKPEHLVAQWNTPERVKRVNPERTEVYYEIHTKAWSLMPLE